AVLGVEVEGAAAPGRQHDEVADLALAPQLRNHIPSAEVDQRLFIVAEAVQVIEHGIAARLVLVEARRKECAIADGVLENGRFYDRALSASLRVQQRSEAERQQRDQRADHT